MDEIGRDSFISWRQLQSEAVKSFNSLIEQMSSTHITSLNLVTAISSTCNLARQRPEKMADVILLVFYDKSYARNFQGGMEMNFLHNFST